MSTITLNRGQARYFVDVALSAASTDAVTPVLCGAHVTVEDGRLRVVCTDRWRAHTALVEAESIEGEPEVIVPRQALLWLRSNQTYFGSYGKHLQRIVIEATPRDEKTFVGGELVVTVKEHEQEDAGSVQWAGKHVNGKFPPIITLIEKARDAEAVLATPRFRLDFLGRMSVLGKDGPDIPPRIKFTANNNPNKPGPVYVSWNDTADGAPYAEALVQPYMERS